MYIYSHNDNKRNNKPKIFLTVVLTIFITVVVIENIIILIGEGRENYAATRLSATNEYLNLEKYANTKTESSSASVIENVKDVTVGIGFLKPDKDSILDKDVTSKWGMGTGIVVTRNGYILTNQHLAQNIGARMVVSLNDGTTAQGKVVWNEKNIDLAIIKIDKKNMKAASLGNSSNIYVGDNVFAVGNPLGSEFQGTTTKGIISGTNRTFSFEENGEKFFMEGLIQTDASINPGNSGGPLVDESGRVIGINTVKLSDAEGIGFAVPIIVVKPIIEKLENEESFEEATLGIYAYDREVIPYMDANERFDKGIYVSSVDKYGPAGKAGIKEGDIITSIDNVEIDKMIELREFIYSKNVGDEITLHVRDGVEKDVKVVLGKK